MDVAQAVVSDLFAHEKRGTYMGMFLAPMLIGNIVGPAVGGIRELPLVYIYAVKIPLQYYELNITFFIFS